MSLGMPCRGLLRTHQWLVCGKPKYKAVSTWEVHFNALQSSCESHAKPTQFCLEGYWEMANYSLLHGFPCFSLLKMPELVTNLKNLKNTSATWKPHQMHLWHHCTLITPLWDGMWRWKVNKNSFKWKNCTISVNRRYDCNWKWWDSVLCRLLSCRGERGHEECCS